MTKALWFPYNHSTNSSNLRLFCFGHSGSAASIFRNWQPQFSPCIEIWPLQLPGRETSFSEPLITSLNVLIDKLYPNILPLMEAPFAMFGHSLGALIAFELARKIENSPVKANLRKLFVSACSAPSVLTNESSIHSLPDEAFLETLIHYGAMHPQLLENKDALKVLLPRIRADFSVFETYRYSPVPPLETPIVALAGQHDTVICEENITAWKNHAKESFSFYSFSGGHFYPQTNLQDLCHMINQHLISYL